MKFLIPFLLLVLVALGQNKPITYTPTGLVQPKTGLVTSNWTVSTNLIIGANNFTNYLTWVNVKLYGATGDGTTDDTAAIEAADAAAALTKASLYFPPGTYSTTGLVPAQFAYWIGANSQGEKNPSEGSTIIKKRAGNNTSVITVTTEFQIRGIQIDGESASQTGTSYGLYFNNIAYIESRVEQCSIVDCLTAGIYVGSHELSIVETHCIENAGYGIFIAPNIYDTIIQNVLIGWNGDDGFYHSAGAAGTRITELDSYYNRGNGVVFMSPSLVKVDRLQIDRSFKNGLVIDVTSAGSIKIDWPLVYESNYNDDGRGRTNAAATGTYSDFVISGNAYPSSIVVNDGRIGPLYAGAVKSPLYAMVWSNSIPETGYNVHFQNVNVDIRTPVATTSGKSGNDGWITGYWDGALYGYNDGTNVLVNFAKDHGRSLRWDGLSPNGAQGIYNGTNYFNSETYFPGKIAVGGATIQRDVTTSKTGIQVNRDVGGDLFRIISLGAYSYLGSDSADGQPQLEMDGVNNTWNFQSLANWTSTNGVAIASTNLSVFGTNIFTIIANATAGLGGTTFTNLSQTDANTVEEKNSTAQQVFNLYGTYTDASNYERVKLTQQTYSGGDYFTLTAEEAGTGDNRQNIVIQPKAGSFSLQMPDGTTTGGNARGVGAVDFQMSRGAAGNVASGVNSGLVSGADNTASGIQSFVSGGLGNTASGQRSFIGGGAYNTASQVDASVLGGQGNAASGIFAVVSGGSYNTASGSYSSVTGGGSSTASSDYAEASGASAIANKYGQRSRGTVSGHQREEYTAFLATTDATASELRLDGTLASANRLALGNNETWGFTITVTGRTSTAGANVYNTVIQGCITKGTTAGSTAIVGTNVVLGTQNTAGAAAWVVTATADTTNGALAITVTGAAATNINWHADVRVNKVTKS
jgi:hypothetical protein